MNLDTTTNKTLLTTFLSLGIVTMIWLYISSFDGSKRTIAALTLIPLFVGVVYENKRLAASWLNVLIKACAALLVSFFVYLPSRHEDHYNPEAHLEMWPVMFVVWFVLISVAFHDKKLIPRLTEGLTLLQSIALIYWILDIGALSIDHPLLIGLIALVVPFIAFSLFHAFSKHPLNRNVRLTLSLWSSIIMLVFAIEHFYLVFKMLQDIDSVHYGLIALQFFLVGIAVMYSVQNLFMLTTYLPGKQQIYDKKHRKEIRKMNDTFIARYSEEQVSITEALLALIVLGVLFYFNHKERYLPRHTMIWITLWLFPQVLSLRYFFRSTSNSKPG